MNTQRVHMLLDSSRFYLTPEAVLTIALTRPEATIFPNVKRLAMRAQRLETFFMSPSLQSIDLFIDSLEVLPLFSNIRDRMPNITSLGITFDQGLTRSTHHAHIVDLVRSLVKLERLMLPATSFSAHIAQAIQHHPNLNGIVLDRKANIPINDTVQLFSPEVALDHDAFPSLRIFSFSAPLLTDAATILNPNAHWIHGLTYLWLHIEAPPERQEVTKFLDTLSRVSDSLYFLNLRLHKTTYIADEEEDFADADLTDAHLKLHDLLPILQFKRLTDFSITCPYPLEMTNQEASELARQWPHLRHLYLNPRPILPYITSLSLAAYRIFVDTCPKLTSIGLYVNATLPPPHFDFPPIWKTGTPIHFWTGHSPLPTDEASETTIYPAIAHYLSTFLSRASRWQIASEFDPKVVGGGIEWLSEMADFPDIIAYEHGWRMIQAMTNMILLERSITRERTWRPLAIKAHALQDENKSLREKYNRLLESQKEGLGRL